MRRTYHTLIEFTDETPSTIRKISVPDLGIHISEDDLFVHELEYKQEHEQELEYKLNQICPRTTKFIQHQIENRIKEIVQANQIIPENKFEVGNLKENQILLEINVNVEEVKRGFFTRWLPRMGFSLNVVTAISGVIINVAQMELAMGDSGDKRSATALALLQAIVSNSVGIMFYVYLKSGRGLEKIGVKLDEILSGKKPAPIEDPNKSFVPRSRCMSTGIVLMNLALGGTVIALQLGNATSQKGGLTALGDQYSQIDSIIPEAIFNMAKWTLISCGGTVGLIMVGMIFSQLSDDIQNWLTRRERSRAIGSSGVEITDTDELKEVVAEDQMESGSVADSQNVEATGVSQEVQATGEVELGVVQHDAHQLLDDAVRSESMAFSRPSG